MKTFEEGSLHEREHLRKKHYHLAPRFISSKLTPFQKIMLLMISAAIIILLSVIGVIQYTKERNINMVGLRTSRALLDSFSYHRYFYYNEILPRGEKAGLSVDIDFHQKENTLPPHRTFLRAIGKEIEKMHAGTSVRLYSRYPFIDTEEITLDGFRIEALEFFEETPDKPFYRIEKVNGKLSMRYAVADMMHSRCISCHNTHERSPKRDWEVGDVGGATEVTIPMDDVDAQVDAVTIRISGVIAGLISIITVILLLFVRQTNVSVKKLLQIVEQTDDMVVLTDKNGTIEYVNRAFEKYTGYNSDETIEKSINFLKSGIHDDDYYPDTSGWNALMEGETYHGKLMNRKKNGELYYAETTITPLKDRKGNIINFALTQKDITDNRQREDENKLRQLITLSAAEAPDFESAINAILREVCETASWVYGEAWLPDENNNVLVCGTSNYCSDESTEIFYAKSTSFTFKNGVGLPGMVWRSGDPTWIRDVTEEKFYLRAKLAREAGLKAAVGVPIIEHERLVIVMCFYLRDVKEEDERFVNLLSAISNDLSSILQRKKAEEALVESEKRYRTLFEESKDVVFISTPEGKFLDINPAGVELFGYDSKEELLKVDISALYGGPEKRDEFNRLIKQQGYVKDLELELKTKDGKKLIVLETATSVRDETGQIVSYRGILRDVTEQKALQQQLIQSQKLESIGTLAGGIAHDFNNILSIIMGHATLLEFADRDQEKFLRSIEAISKAAKRGASLVMQLLTFARKTEVNLETVRINDIIIEITKFMQETFPKTIVISTELQNDIPYITADATQLHQVILNLCVNARDAMPGGGTLSIAATIVEGTILLPKYTKATAGKYVSITVSDTGTGIDEITLEKIFEPFFTTKDPGKGTGLGLSLVYSIVESHGGFVDVASKVDEGTTFSIFLPVQEHSVEMSYDQKKEIQEVQGGTETILLVEDEELLRDMMNDVLVSKGYTVITAEDGNEGIEAFLHHQKDISVVILDMGLPRMGGDDVFKRIRTINPEARIILASGFIEPQVKSELYKSGAKYFIQKPYVPNEVLGKIREVIENG